MRTDFSNSINLNPKKQTYCPLEQLEICFPFADKLIVMDGEGEEYWSGTPDSEGKACFHIGGALGTQNILAFSNGKLAAICSFRVNTATQIKDSKNVFKNLLENLYITMTASCNGDGARICKINGKKYHYFICWLRDHTHTMKGMKYFYPELKTGFELYADSQREDGMVYDRFCRRESSHQGWRDYTFKKGNFAKFAYSNADGTGIPYSFQRIPVENDLEFLFIECLYFVWKATGDNEWMSKYLDHALKAVKYATSDPYRWSEKFKLLKRGYTIDTWDFMHKDDCALTLGDNICDIDKTTFGIMFGDNTGMAVSLRYLAEMLQTAGRSQESENCQKLANEILERLEKISWNGHFYTHHVSENPAFKRDVGNTDESAQVTLSNAYSINREIGTEKSLAIIETYKRIRKEMPSASPGEFYNCYPPFEKGFGDHNSLWQYMNGGVSTIVAGELARGAFNFGEEEYGIDILERIISLAKRYDGHLHVCFNGNPSTTPPANRKFTKIPFDNSANISLKFCGDSSWGEENNDLSKLPIGEMIFQHIPFDVQPKAIGISFSKKGYQKEKIVPIGGKYASLYFLHTTNAHGIVAEVEICYSDGQSHFMYIENGKHLSNWFMPGSGEIHSYAHAPKLPNGWPLYQLAWRGSSGKFDNVGIFVCGINNPRPEAEIDKIIFRAPKKNGEYLLIALTGSDYPVWFPQSDLSFGIPDSWGAAAVVYALIEGLAGVIDKGTTFSKAEVSPRWLFANETKSDVVIKYEASGGYVAYTWLKDGDKQCLLLTSSAIETTVRIPCNNAKKPEITVNGKTYGAEIEKVGKTPYIVVKLSGRGVFDIKLS